MSNLWRLIKIVILLLLIGVVSLFVSHQWKKPQQQFSHTLKVLTYNTHALCMGNKQQAQQMLAYLNEQEADIVCLQEVSVYKNEKRMTLTQLRQAMSQYPYTYYDFKRYNSRRQFGNVVFSRYPLINKQTISYDAGKRTIGENSANCIKRSDSYVGSYGNDRNGIKQGQSEN